MHPLHRRLLGGSGAARWHMGAAVALGVATAVCVIAQALLLARIIAGVFMDGQSLGDVRGDLIALAVVSVARGVLAWGYEMAGHVGAVRVMSAMRVGLVAHLLRGRPAAAAEGSTAPWRPPPSRAWTRWRPTSGGTCRRWSSRCWSPSRC